MTITEWEVVHFEPNARVRRFSVPGGWLYQVELERFTEPVGQEPGTAEFGWNAPVFVPAAREGS